MEFENDKVLNMVNSLGHTSSKIEGMLKNYRTQFDSVKDEIQSMKKSMKQDFDNQMNAIK